MKFPKIFQRAASDTRKPSDNPQKALWSTINKFAATFTSSKSLKEEFEARKALKNPVVFRCVDKIAGAVQSVPWYVEHDPDVSAADQGKITDIALATYQEVLNAPYELAGAQLRYWIASVYALYGRAPLKIGVYNGSANAIYPLLPGKISYDIDDFGSIASYTYGDVGHKSTIPSFNKAKNGSNYPKESFAFEIRKPRITLDLEKGTSPLDAIMLPAEIITLLYNRAYDLADGTPNIKHILFSKQVLSDAEKENVTDEIESRKVGGGGERDGYLFLEGMDIGHIELKDNLADLHTKIPLDDMARQIAGAFGVPVALLGFAGADGSKFANNYNESRKSFWEDTIIPQYLAPIEEAMSANICPRGMRIRFDRDAIPALYESRLAAAKELDGISFLTDEEKREAAGYAKDKPETKNAQK